MENFDLISDIHLDFWISKFRNSNEPVEEIIEKFVELILPNEISDVLVIAGDLGHHNEQNYKFLTQLKKYYKFIIIVPGNHDYYLINSTAKYKYNTNSTNRWKEMKKLGGYLEGVHFLEGDLLNIDGVTFGGTGMWYDFSYGIIELNKKQHEMSSIWYEEMNDGKYIFGSQKNIFYWFNKELKQLESIIEKSDIIITHVGPDWSKIPEKYKLDPITGCYFFNGEEQLKKCSGKIWCFGHTHNKNSYIKNNCWLINNSLGYPGESRHNISKIANIPINTN
jgi:Predicted phosphohydrolases